MVLICKWGCDGASGQSKYKQIQHENYNIIDDACNINVLQANKISV